jgi:hypothetical protein
MTNEQASMAVGGCCLLAHVAATLLVLRLPGRASPVVRHAAVAMTVHVSGTILGAWSLGHLSYWPCASVYWCGVIIYLFGYCAVYKSVSLRILCRLLPAPGNRAAFADITAQFVLPEFVQRTDVMKQMGWVEENDGRFTLTEKGRQAARSLEVVQAIFGIERSGMYGSAV